MRLVASPDGLVDRRDRALWFTRPFDIAWSSTVIDPDPDPDLPASLPAALQAWWDANSLRTTVAPLYTHGAPPSLTPAGFPLVLLDGLDEVLPGPTADTTPVEMYLTVFAASASVARAKAHLVSAWLDSTTDDDPPARNPNRPEPLAWATGAELFCERDESSAGRRPAPAPGGQRMYPYRMHYRWWITGRW